MESPTLDALTGFLSHAVATLVELDPDGKRNLAQLDGRVLCLEITLPPVTLYLLPHADGIEIRHQVESVPDVTLTGSAIAFARLSSQGVAGRVLTEGQVTVNGDAELGQAFQKILSDLDLDWEELLSRYIGDTPARKVGNLMRGFKSWADQSFDLSRQNTADYLKEEKRILVTGLAMERFEAAVNQARSDVDRMRQRMDRLRQVLDQHSNS